MPRGFVLCAALACSVWAGSVPADQTPGITARVRGFEQTQAWFTRVRAHEIGQFDDSAAAVASLTPPALQQILDDVRLIRKLVDAAAADGDARVDLDSQGRSLSIFRLAALMGLAGDDLDLPLDLRRLADPNGTSRRVISRVMTRAALLHTRIAMELVPDVVGGLTTDVRIRDGQVTRIVDRTVHWAIAREAFDMVGPPPAGSAAARVWYRATSSYLQSQRNYTALVPHLEHARAVLPTEAWVFRFSGAACENLAAPTVQSAADELGGSGLGLAPPGDLLKQAERHLRRALELEPDSGLARLRLGRVLDVTGRHDEAAGQLQQAEAALSDPILRYFAALYLGRAEESRGEDVAGRAAYERAMTLFPHAQSPRLALAGMAWRIRDQAEAAAGLRALFGPADPAERRTDPWWTYDVSHVGDVPALFEEMRLAVMEALR